MSVNMHRWEHHQDLHGVYHVNHANHYQSAWPYPQQYQYNHHMYQSPSNNRHQRNMAEKMRRDKLNFFINELSTLVPIISFSPKKLDKTSILRLAATYIRLHNVIFGSARGGRERRSSATPSAAVQGQMMEYLPQYLASFNWSENVLEEMDGMLMIVNGAGRIIFISHTVEKLLGHTQIELMGQSLFNLTCLEDYDELKRNLAPDEDQAISAATSDAGADDNSTDSVYNSPAPCSSTSMPGQEDQRLRRSFYIRLRQRAQSRSDQPQYELVHVMGHLRAPPPAQTRRSDSPPNHNDIILVAVVKPFREKRITTLSLMEACREEFITRHTLDGRIIYTDHRISIVAGYLSEEVCGVPGFQYMHKEDMRWTMVGLRQMFFRGSSYGQSCYRLQTKNGNFIYLKTCGYLELSENNDSFQSLICINSLVTAGEGEALIKQMKEQYSPVIKNKSDRNMEILSSNIQNTGGVETSGETEDKKLVDAAINQMLSNVPSPAPFMHSPASSNIDPTDSSFVKATLAAKALPPLHVIVKKIGIVPPIIRTPAAVAASLSPPSSHHSPPPPTAAHSPPRPVPAPSTQDRPSVLRVAHRQGDQVSVMKVKKMRIDWEGSAEVMSEHSPASAPVSPRGVLVAPGCKRKSEEWTQAPAPSQFPLLVPAKHSSEDEWSMAASAAAPPLPTPTISPPPFPLEVSELLRDTDFPDFPDNDESPPSLPTNLEDIYGMTLSWQPEILETSHQTLDSRVQLQSDQIQDIQRDLTLVPPEHSNTNLYNSRLSQLQVEHRKQVQILRSLQQDLGQQNVEV
ncbi:basic helix-loop-helix ARNT-like protein 2 isoform X3 [Macrosteles quadrilineatus]|uniref:basic helix-loop-helix ARNT-like protein 2 isoform X3 n=1 Tax=Macrosteles quadrilineatus TaxID=74068 RepID=UPI0023E1F14D|nr:basic helix-loop-helix ARNT-like protein 2 isoform X3 [Macrosteles quadrilineatus]